MALSPFVPTCKSAGSYLWLGFGCILSEGLELKRKAMNNGKTKKNPTNRLIFTARKREGGEGRKNKNKKNSDGWSGKTKKEEEM